MTKTKARPPTTREFAPPAACVSCGQVTQQPCYFCLLVTREIVNVCPRKSCQEEHKKEY